MMFGRFRRHRPAGGPGEPPQPGPDEEAGPAPSQPVSPQTVEGSNWRDSGIAEEATAYLDGRYVDHLVVTGQPVPAWAALNRVSHADHEELERLVGGSGLDRTAHPSRRLHAWAEQERFLAAHLLATSGATPEGLARCQLTVLIPVELALIERSKTEQFRPEEVLESAAEALDKYRTGA